MYIKGLVGMSEEETKIANQVKVACCNNMATVHLKDEKFNRVIKLCNQVSPHIQNDSDILQVLEIETNNTKAIFRRGKAYLALGDLDRAEVDLNKAASLDPKDAGIQRELLVLKKKNKEQDKKQQKFYSNLFEKMSKEKDEEKVTVAATEDKDLATVNKDEYVGMEDS